jgi:hypothetical protein
MQVTLDHRKLYRLPWSLTDNVVSWLEPTKECNISCDGCYSANVKGSHKSLEAIRAELEVFDRQRQTDGVSVAGGEPLVHPQIVEVVRMIADMGLKPIVNSNGQALTPELLREMKKAGLFGMTFHIDSLQRRAGWTGKSELELNALRLHYAEMVAAAGDVSCSFNATVYEKTLPLVPDLIAWARQHADKVQVMVFIAFRQAVLESFDYYSGERRVDMSTLTYTMSAPQRIDISANEIVATIQERFPEFAPAAYLNGTEKPDSFKWLATIMLTDRERFLGSAGPRVMELAQVTNHLFKGRYLGYAAPKALRRGKATAFGLAPFDPGMRKVVGNYLRASLRNPVKLFEPIYTQSIMIIQPVDVLPDGRQSMCDSCPDMTVYDGELVWSCRLDERHKCGGQLMRVVPKEQRSGVIEQRS